VAGYRYSGNGSFIDYGYYGRYCSGTVNGIYSRNLYFYSGVATMGNVYRADGFSVRCLKD
jgi:hypothetical protein